ncbi:MAG: helix-turn-helix domain-containing protein [Sphingomonas bacterium]
MAMNAIPLDRYVIETLMGDLVGHDRRPSAFLVYLLTEASDGEALSYATIAERTGLSRRSCQAAVAHLERRRLIEIVRRAENEAAIYRPLRPWRR